MVNATPFRDSMGDDALSNSGWMRYFRNQNSVSCWRKVIKGPSFQYDMRAQRIWICPGCGKSVPTSGAVTSRLCSCREPPYFMRLQIPMPLQEFDLSAFADDDPSLDVEDDGPDGLEEATAAVLAAIAERIENTVKPARRNYPSGLLPADVGDDTTAPNDDADDFGADILEPNGAGGIDSESKQPENQRDAGELRAAVSGTTSATSGLRKSSQKKDDGTSPVGDTGAPRPRRRRRPRNERNIDPPTAAHRPLADSPPESKESGEASENETTKPGKPRRSRPRRGKTRRPTDTGPGDAVAPDAVVQQESSNDSPREGGDAKRRRRNRRPRRRRPGNEENGSSAQPNTD
ncbi:MAG: hypothetical protein KDA91_22745 [Planctomycetaceae bacterium]|nr:hypothetical protein [Planctomycetaceae bacterium]